MTNNEYAEMEAFEIHTEDEYFNVRREMDCENSRMMFRAGFERGYKHQEQQPEKQTKSKIPEGTTRVINAVTGEAVGMPVVEQEVFTEDDSEELQDSFSAALRCTQGENQR